MRGWTIVWLTTDKRLLAFSSSRVDPGPVPNIFGGSHGQALLPYPEVQQCLCETVVRRYSTTEGRGCYFHSSREGHNHLDLHIYRFF